MYVIGDIGNTETKICIFNNNKKLLKKKILNTNNINFSNLKNSLSFMRVYSKKIKKIIFSSVVPNVFKIIKKTIKKRYKLKVKELKQCNFKKKLKVEVNMKQVGSDRLANAISVMNNQDNFIIVDFGTATTFDVVLKNNYKGGIIAPGVNLSLKTLVKKAKLIPNMKLMKTKKKFKVILTGGLSHLYKKSLRKKIKVDKDLTVKGLLKLIN